MELEADQEQQTRKTKRPLCIEKDNPKAQEEQRCQEFMVILQQVALMLETFNARRLATVWAYKVRRQNQGRPCLSKMNCRLNPFQFK